MRRPADKIRAIVLADKPGAIERDVFRTLAAKTFDVGEGKLRVIRGLQPSHWKNDLNNPAEPWKEIDLEIKNNAISDGFYSIDFDPTKVAYTYTSKRGGVVKVRLTLVGLVAPNYASMTVLVEENKYTWRDVAPGVDMYVLCMPGYAELFKVIKDASADRSFTWAIEEEDTNTPGRPAELIRATAGVDANNDPLEIVNDVVDDAPSRGKRTLTFKETWTGRVSRRIGDGTRNRTWFNDPAYPAVIDLSITENIADTNQDGISYVNYPDFYPDLLKIGTSFGGNVTGLRFTTVALPQGATISSAILTLRVADLTTPGPQGKFYGVAADNAAAWATTTNPPHNATNTAASVSINESTTGLKTYDVTAIVQEIVNRAGFASNNAVAFVGRSAGSTKYIRLEDFAAAGTDEAQLDVTYTTGSTATLSATEYGDSLLGVAGVAISVASSLAEGNDAVSAAATVAISSALAVTEDYDSLAATSELAVSVTASIAEGDDALVASATAGASANLTAVELDDSLDGAAAAAVAADAVTVESADELSSDAAVATTASMAIVEDGDALASDAVAAIEVSAAFVENDDLLASTATTTGASTTDLDAVERDDVLSAAAEVATALDASIGEQDDALSAAGDVSAEALLAVVEQDDELIASTAAEVAANAASTEEADSLFAEAAVADNTGALAVSEQDDAVSASATAEIDAVSVIVEEQDQVSGAATADIVATAAISESDDALASTLTTSANVTATCEITEGDDACSGAAVTSISTAAEIIEDGDILLGAASLAIAALALITEDADLLTASTIPINPDAPGLINVSASLLGMVSVSNSGLGGLATTTSIAR